MLPHKVLEIWSSILIRSNTAKLRTFPLFDEDVSLGKSFYITESKRIDFRWEAFNLFNRTQFGAPNTNLNSSTFGVISTQNNSPRQMQGALKFYW